MRRVLGVSSVLAAVLAHASPPSQFTVQGVLRDGSGNLRTTSAAISVSLFNAETGGTRVAGPFSQPAVPVSNGLFTITIEDPTLATVAAANSALWMEISAGGDVFPRSRVTSTFYALSAADSDRLGGLPPASYQRALGTSDCGSGRYIQAVAPDGRVTCADAPLAPDAGAGLTLSGRTLSVDTSTIQARVTGTCPAGQAMTAVGASGTVSCVTVPVPPTAGTGLTLSAGTLSVNTSTIQARVTGSCPPGQAITAVSATGAVTCAAPPVITVASSVQVNNGTFGILRVDCPAGYIATGGGVDVNNVLTMQLSSSGPIVNGGRTIFLASGQHGAPTGWQGSAINNTGGTAPMVVTAICTRVQ